MRTLMLRGLDDLVAQDQKSITRTGETVPSGAPVRGTHPGGQVDGIRAAHGNPLRRQDVDELVELPLRRIDHKAWESPAPLALSYAGQMVVKATPVTFCFVANWMSVDPNSTSSDLTPAFADVIKGCLVAIKQHLLA
jgi:hypothetical protein